MLWRMRLDLVWPSLYYYHTMDGVIENYTLAATDTRSLLLPVGQAWKAYFEKNKTFDLYGSDGFHPSKKGSQLAAEIIVKTIMDLN